MSREQAIKFKKESKALVYPTGSVLGYAHIYSLGIVGIPIVALNRNKCPNFKSRYVKEKYIVPDPKKDHEAFVSWLIDYGKKQKHKPVLFFAEDVYAYIASLYQKELKPYYLYPYIDHDSLDIFFNKKVMFEAAAKTDISLPFTKFSPLTKEQIANWKHFPAILKPQVSRFNFQGRKLVDVHKFPILFGGKAVKATHSNELKDYTRRLSEENLDYCLQEYVPGKDINLASIKFVADEKGEIPSCFINLKVRQNPTDIGTCCVGKSKYIQRLHDYAEQFCKTTKYVGPGAIEFKWHPDKQQWYFMEINPRSVFSTNIATNNGVNLPLQHYLLSTGQELFRRRQREQGRYWIDIRGDLAGLRWRQKRKEWRLSFWEIIKPYFYFNEAVFNLRDPAPGLGRLIRAFLHKSRFIMKSVRGKLENSKSEDNRTDEAYINTFRETSYSQSKTGKD